MYVTIDLTRMCVVHKHADWRCAAALCFIELSDAATATFPADSAGTLRERTDLELRLLYRNTLGEDCADNVSRDVLLARVYLALAALAPTRANAAEAVAQANALPENAVYARYKPGSATARRLRAPEDPPPLVVPAAKAEEIKLLQDASGILPPVSRKRTLPQPVDEEPDMAKKKPAAKVADKPTPAKAKAKAAPAPKAKAKAKADKAPAVERVSQNGVTRPKAGGLCAAVWDIADKLSAKLGGAPVPIADLLTVCEGKGLNLSNARSEYARWRKFNGHVGRAKKG